MLVKICGLKTLEPAQTAVESGANLLGSIMVPGRARTVDPATALQISEHVKQVRAKNNSKSVAQLQEDLLKQTFTSDIEYYTHISREISTNGPYFVGVFRNQPIDEVLKLATDLKLDFVQLHGSENKPEYVKQLKHAHGIVLRYVLQTESETMEPELSKFAQEKTLVLPLLDSEAGGEGNVIDWASVDQLEYGRFILAGGLTPENLEEASKVRNVIGYDVSGGVETEGVKDLAKVRKFVEVGRKH